MGGQISQRFVKQLQPLTGRNVIHYDPEVRGFGIRVTSNGVKSFVLNYHFRGREKRFTIGRFPEMAAEQARNEAIRLRDAIRGGEDPLDQRNEARRERTVADLATEYLERHARPNKRATSVRNDEQMIAKIITPTIGQLRVSAVDRRDVELLHQSMKSVPYRANRVLALLSSMFTKAWEWKYRPDNPAKGVERFHEERRDGWLAAEQLQALSAALDRYPDQLAANAIRLLVLTGSRAGEVLKAEWSQFDLQRGVWTKPSHSTKQNKTEHVPLNRAALAIVAGMKESATSRYLFPGADGKTPRVTLRRPWVQALKAAGLVEQTAIEGKRRQRIKVTPLWRIHDLRHSFASHLASAGESLHIVGMLLGHTNASTTQRYAHLSDSALRTAADRVSGLIGPRS